ncbi:MAG TPA: hypothetical protein P5572_15640, partial [Phycisphaerae bacterium]|nr:hypothetical protein [Phycisphaerae bacterium]
MRRRYASTLLAVGACSALAAGAWAQVTIDPVVTSIGALRDPVPGRDPLYVFRGESNVQFPVINAAHDVVFRARSASQFDTNAGNAWGIYVKRDGDPLAVLADTTVDDAGTPGFPVPGRSATAYFTDFKAPLLNDTGDVLFHGTFYDPDTGSGSGLYATTVTGGAIVKIADTSDTVPGFSVPFLGFSSAAADQDLTQAVVNDAGQIAFWASFSGSPNGGLFGSTVAGGAIVQLADRSTTPTGVPFGTPQPFTDIRPNFAMNANGLVAFHGTIRLNSSTGPQRNGNYVVPVTGGTLPANVAFQFQVAPDAGGATFSGISDEDIDASGR